MPNLIGNNTSETLEGTASEDLIIGLAGEDQITGGDGADTIHGDYVAENLLEGSAGSTSFSQYGENGAWDVSTGADGHTSMSQTVETQNGTNYSISFDLAANYGSGTISGAVEVIWNGDIIDSFDTNSAVFEAHEVSFTGTGGTGQLTFRSAESTSEPTGPTINTDGPVFHYDKGMEVEGQTITVKAFAEGQTNIYQVIEGQLHVFDPETETYAEAGTEATVKINAIGFNMEDDMIYGIAVADGTDSLGNVVSKADLVMMDAEGNSYSMGSTPYRSWTADFDDSGNLWAFHSSMDRVTMIDVDSFDGDGNPISTTFKFPKDMITDKMWDVAYDATNQCFYGLVKPSAEGAPGKLYTIDISAVSDGGVPEFSSVEIDGTLIDGEMNDGMPALTFGALMIDADGNLYAGGNGGDHDMDDSTGTSGGIYRIETDPDTGVKYLRLVADSPKAYSNDGALDPRAIDPFTEVDVSVSVLIRTPELIPTIDPDLTYDDMINGQGGADEIYGGLGQDTLIGASLGDTIAGGVEDDIIYGGAGPGGEASGIISFYDDDGNRFDQFGNPLPEDDDVLYGGEGDDILDGSAGYDTLSGGIGNDTLTGGSGKDWLSGDEGDDDLNGGKHDDILFGGDGNDLLNGGSGEDTLSGGKGDDTIKGGSGDDTIDAGFGIDVIDAGAGDDIVSGGQGNDRIKSGSGNDLVSGGDGNDYINAHSGDDIVDGGQGKDKIYGGGGSDILAGGEGHDTFVFRTGDLDGSQDIITDFTCDGGESDRIDLRGLDLLSDGISFEDWLAICVSYDSNIGVAIAIEGLTIIFEDHANLDTAFLVEVTDGLMI